MGTLASGPCWQRTSCTQIRRLVRGPLSFRRCVRGRWAWLAALSHPGFSAFSAWQKKLYRQRPHVNVFSDHNLV